jgi:hypothetical protein
MVMASEVNVNYILGLLAFAHQLVGIRGLKRARIEIHARQRKAMIAAKIEGDQQNVRG